MSDKPAINSIADAKAAIDAEIVDLKWWVDLYQRKVDEETANLRRYQEAMWRLQALRNRMDPPELVAVQSEAAAA